MQEQLDFVRELRAIGQLLSECRAHVDVCQETARRLGLVELAEALEAAGQAIRNADDICHFYCVQKTQEVTDASTTNDL